jgi:hypothetical protein
MRVALPTACSARGRTDLRAPADHGSRGRVTESELDGLAGLQAAEVGLLVLGLAGKLALQ